ncbi:MAG: cyclase family protein [Candidatus Peribacteria bacterium]|nr:MAG: cyclase family protein [Candidatus Peribacteria bacterium]
MGVIDLSMELYSGMPVFPGDPDVKIEPIFHYEIDQWNMRRIEMNTHDATHVNVPIHATKNGKTLDNYSLDNFIGEAVKYECDDDIIA